jgi:hypothetical protein
MKKINPILFVVAAIVLVIALKQGGFLGAVINECSTMVTIKTNVPAVYGNGETVNYFGNCNATSCPENNVAWIAYGNDPAYPGYFLAMGLAGTGDKFGMGDIMEIPGGWHLRECDATSCKITKTVDDTHYALYKAGEPEVVCQTQPYCSGMHVEIYKEPSQDGSGYISQVVETVCQDIDVTFGYGSLEVNAVDYNSNPLSDTLVLVYDKQQVLVGKGITDSTGKVVIENLVGNSLNKEIEYKGIQIGSYDIEAYKIGMVVGTQYSVIVKPNQVQTVYVGLYGNDDLMQQPQVDSLAANTVTPMVLPEVPETTVGGGGGGKIGEVTVTIESAKSTEIETNKSFDWSLLVLGLASIVFIFLLIKKKKK